MLVCIINNKSMNKEMFKAVVIRFLRAFAAGSVASMVAILASAQLNADVLKDPHTIIYSLLQGR